MQQVELAKQRATPSSRISIEAERLRFRSAVQLLAYTFHRIRELEAPYVPFQQELLDRVPPDVRAQRDWFMAQDYVGQFPHLVQVVYDKHDALQKQQEGQQPIELYPALAA